MQKHTPYNIFSLSNIYYKAHVFEMGSVKIQLLKHVFEKWMVSEIFRVTYKGTRF